MVWLYEVLFFFYSLVCVALMLFFVRYLVCGGFSVGVFCVFLWCVFVVFFSVSGCGVGLRFWLRWVVFSLVDRFFLLEWG